jgi:hypothetical protein
VHATSNGDTHKLDHRTDRTARATLHALADALSGNLANFLSCGFFFTVCGVWYVSHELPLKMLFSTAIFLGQKTVAPSRTCTAAARRQYTPMEKNNTIDYLRIIMAISPIILMLFLIFIGGNKLFLLGLSGILFFDPVF